MMAALIIKLALLYSYIAYSTCNTNFATTCCQKGMSHSASNLLEDIRNFKCTVTDAMFEELQKEASPKNQLERIMCKGFFAQCCLSAAQSQYCIIGISLGKANQVCLSGEDTVAGKAQGTCCDCCKTGEKAAAKRKHCDRMDFADPLCTHAYKECCKARKKNMPIVTTEATPKTCKDIKCDHKSTTSCALTKNGPVCICKTPGFVPLNDGITCEDFNECQNTDVCKSGECVNTLGSYYCKCGQGLKMVNDTCIKSTGCKQGFERRNGTCVDINECLEVDDKQAKCPSEMICLNTKGAYSCVDTCSYPRFETITTPGNDDRVGNGNSKTYCQDVNECERDANICDNSTQECINLIGGYQCKLTRCYNGFNLTNGRCVDINECETVPGTCGDEGHCYNTEGSYYCVCRSNGFAVNKATKRCEDVNECRLKRDGCSFRCINSIGSYHCGCPRGYEVRGLHCYDINECKTQNPCSSGEYCQNTYGSYRCINETCPHPYYTKALEKNRPASCWKNCHEFQNVNKRLACFRDDSFESVKRVAFNFEKEIKKLNETSVGFEFTYWWLYSNQEYHVDVTLETGNEEGLFEIRRERGASEVKVVNKYKITGKRDFHIVMVTRVTQRGKHRPSKRYRYDIYVSVSEFKLS